MLIYGRSICGRHYNVLFIVMYLQFGWNDKFYIFHRIWKQKRTEQGRIPCNQAHAGFNYLSVFLDVRNYRFCQGEMKFNLYKRLTLKGSQTGK